MLHPHGIVALVLVLVSGAQLRVLAQSVGLDAVPFTAVKLEDEFWAPRIRTTIEKTIPACFDQCESTSRIANWDNAAKKTGAFEGYFFNDSDVYKVMEAAAYALSLDPSAKCKGRKLDEYLDELIAKIAGMQQPDGYVNSYFVLTGEPRWTDIEHKHELYCAGHLIEAAVAHYRMTGKRNFLEIAFKLADHIDRNFGPGRNMNPCGHPEIELALWKLAALCMGYSGGSADQAPSHDQRRRAPRALHAIVAFAPERFPAYARLAQFFVGQHGQPNGRAKLWGEYAQDHKPLTEQSEIVGHAVRAMYLLSAATDGGRHEDDPSKLIRTLNTLWDDLTQRKMYITGGIGSSAKNEGFTSAYDLPNENAYAETCASIGLVFWAHRMNLLSGDAKYFDVLERALYNNVLSAISLDGTLFNYVNPLYCRSGQARQPWHKCACCPPNLARLIPTVGGYIYAVGGDSIYVNLYAKSTAAVPLDGNVVTIRQDTRYPWDGRVEIAVSVEQPCEFNLKLRVPGWCAGATLSIGDEKIESPEIDRGYIQIAGKWRGETKLRLDLPMPAVRQRSDERVKANVGRVALQRGPIVYCAESADNGPGLRSSFLPGDAAVDQEFRADLLGGIVMLTTKREFAAPQPSVTAATASGPASQTLRAIPYYARSNRTAGEMQVWFSEDAAHVDPLPLPGVRASASHCWGSDSVEALFDRVEPANSADESIPRFTWWPKKGDQQWVQLEFDERRRVSGVALYWFNDERAGGGCRPPTSWKLQYRSAGEWRDVTPRAPFGIASDTFNEAAFEAIETDALRVTVQLAAGHSSGILEWRVSSP